MKKNKYQNRLGELRVQRGMKQVELASLAGLGNATVNRIERWHFHVADATAQRLAEALDCEVGDVFPFLIAEQAKRH